MLCKTFDIPYYGLDAKHRMKIGLLLEFFQETADLDSQKMKASIEYLQSKNLTWVLRRYRIRVDKYPGRETLTIRSWHEPHRNLLSLRSFEVTDASGEKVATAWSSWVVLDRERMRPIRLDHAMPPEYYACAEPTGEFISDDVSKLDESAPFGEHRYTARLSELDVNGHVNHTVYFTWAMESAPREITESMSVSELDAEFLYSVLREDVIVRTQKISDAPLKYLHCIYLAENDTAAARVTTVWR